MFGRVVYLHIRISEPINTNMFMIVIIYLTNIFKDNHIFLFMCSHSNSATLKAMNKMLRNRKSISKNITYFKEIMQKNEELHQYIWLFNIGLYLFYIESFFALASNCYFQNIQSSKLFFTEKMRLLQLSGLMLSIVSYGLVIKSSLTLVGQKAFGL